MTSEDIEIFLLTVNTRNISKTATILYMAQSTVSHRLILLEEELGVTLFKRQKGKRLLSLTPQGADFIPIAEQWMDLWDKTQSLSGQYKDTVSLSIGSIPSLNRTFLMPVCNRLLASQSPQINLTLRYSLSAYLYNAIEQHEHDVAFIAQVSHHNTIETVPLFHEQMLLIHLSDQARPGEPIWGEAVNPRDFDPQKEVGTVFQFRFMQWRKNTLGFAQLPPVNSNDPFVVQEFLKQPGRWAMATFLIALSYSHYLPLEFHPMMYDPPMRVCYMLTNKDSCQEKRVAFELLCGELNRQMESLAERNYITIINPL